MWPQWIRSQAFLYAFWTKTIVSRHQLKSIASMSRHTDSLMASEETGGGGEMTEEMFSTLLGHSLQQPLYSFVLDTPIQSVPVFMHKYVWGVICLFKIAPCSPHSCPCVMFETLRMAESEREENMFLTNKLQFGFCFCSGWEYTFLIRHPLMDLEIPNISWG